MYDYLTSMKRILAYLFSAILIGCSGASNQQSLTKERDSLKNLVTAYEDTINSLRSKVSALETKVDELENGENRLVGLIQNSISKNDYISAISYIQQLKEKHPESSKISNYQKNLSTYQAKANAQKAAKEKAMKDSIRLAKIEETGIWTIKHYVDEFKQPTDEAYITNTSTISGTFSNSATDNSLLSAYFLIDGKDDISIKLLEYGSSTVKDSNGSYVISVKDNNDKTHKFYAKNYSDRLTISGSYSGYEKPRSLFNILMAGGKIQFYIKESDSYGIPSTYNFTIQNADYFGNAYYKLTGKFE